MCSYSYNDCHTGVPLPLSLLLILSVRDEASIPYFYLNHLYIYYNYMYTSKGEVCLFKHNQVGTSEIWAIIKLIWVTWMSVYQHCKNAYTIYYNIIVPFNWLTYLHLHFKVPRKSNEYFRYFSPQFQHTHTHTHRPLILLIVYLHIPLGDFEVCMYKSF